MRDAVWQVFTAMCCVAAVDGECDADDEAGAWAA
jgi:hypothetical protein